MRATRLARAAIFLSILVFLPGGMAISNSPGPGGLQPPEYAPDRILVKFKPGVSTAVGLSTVRNFPSIRVQAKAIPAGQSAEAWVQVLSHDPRVEYAELDYKRTIAVVPNDPRFNELWGMNNTGQTGGTPGADIDAPQAWDLTTGSGSVVVAVIDTGVDYNHVDLAANIWTNPGEIPGNGLDDDHNGYVDDVHGINAITGSGNPMDDHYHGTHCAGTIGARGNNGIGVVGVCWNVRIMALKFLSSSGSGYTSDAITCIEYAISKGANILSNSWGGGGYDQSLKDAIDAAQAAGILFVAAAGNDGLNTDIYSFYPACYSSSNIVSVAATNHNDALASYSNWGSNYGPTTVDVGAPGVSILSTLPGNQYGLLSGTSMATPHVAGLAALLKGYNSGWTWQDIKGRILDGVTPLAGLDGLILTGGRINAYNSLPSGGPVVTTAAATNITETTADTGGEVVSDGGNAVTDRGVCWGTSAYPTIAGSHTNDGAGTGAFVSYLTDLAAGTLYHVRAYATNSVTTAYGEDLTFTTAGGVFAVTSPTTGDHWSRGSTYAITWDKGTSTSAYVKILLYKGNKKVKTISLQAPNNGSFNWKIPNAQGVASNYRVRIMTTDGKYSAWSGYFAIVKPSIVITSPTAGAVWTRGTTRTITWNKVGDQSAAVTIMLYKGTAKVLTIASGASNNGSYSWTIPTGLAVGTNYKIKIVTLDNAVKAKSPKFKIN
jgi:subtilisin family serine protease